jgi:hypothetical protein
MASSIELVNEIDRSAIAIINLFLIDRPISVHLQAINIKLGCYMV